ncbi:MAG: phosphoglycerate dehydrogenase [Acidobacteria bacterium]|nr:MAG: phosphoglycerate dehydrogenase [Acidobacteriota bacterium]
MKILIAEKISPAALKVFRDEPEFEIVTSEQMGEVMTAVRDADALVVRSATDVNAKLIDAAQKLRVIGRAGVGVDNVDTEAATRKGIVVMNTPGANAIAVAEHTLGLMLSLARFIPRADQSTRAGKWEKKSLQGTELRGKTLGIVGLGRVGVEVARRAKAFAMKVIAYDPFVSQQLARDLEIELAALDLLYAASDYISLHVGLTPQTEGMINDAALAKMKKGVRLVNCARGELIDDAALLQALNSGHVAGAALDVFTQEPPKENPLLAAPNVIATPHIAGSTNEAQELVGVQIAMQVREYLKRSVIQNAVNVPSLSDEEYGEMQPYIELSEKLGLFVGQLSEGNVESITVGYHGKVAEWKTALLRNSALKGTLKQSIDSVNLVNAGSVAAERGIQVQEQKKPEDTSSGNVISLVVRTHEGEHRARGVVLHGRSPRLLDLDGFHVEAPLEGHLTVLRNRDVPGVIGQVGTVLGKNEINIANFALGRSDASASSAIASASAGAGSVRAEAMAVVQTDQAVSPSALQELKRISAVISVRAVQI